MHIIEPLFCDKRHNVSLQEEVWLQRQHTLSTIPVVDYKKLNVYVGNLATADMKDERVMFFTVTLKNPQDKIGQ